LEIKRKWAGTMKHIEEKANTALRTKGWVSYTETIELLTKGAAVAERLANYFADFMDMKDHVVRVGGFGACNDTCTFHIAAEHIFWQTGKRGMVEVNLRTGKIMVNVDGLHERNKWVEYKKPIEVSEVMKHLKQEPDCVIGESDWFGKSKVKVLDEIRYASTIYEFEMRIIHPTLGYTTMRKHYREFMKKHSDLLEYVVNPQAIQDFVFEK
jgi:hypothetical protein